MAVNGHHRFWGTLRLVVVVAPNVHCIYTAHLTLASEATAKWSCLLPKNRNRSAVNRRARQTKPPMRFGPSQLKTNVELRHQFRFTSSSATSTTITDNLLLTAAGVSVNTVGTGGRAINQSVKVNQIEIWSPPASQGAAVTCSVLFPASNTSPAREFTDTSVSVSQPAHIVCSPPPQSLAAFWQAGTAQNMFTLVAPPGSIIDVWLSLILVDGTPNNAITAVLVGAAFGSIYYCSLDSNTSAGSIYKPVGLSTA